MQVGGDKRVIQPFSTPFWLECSWGKAQAAPHTLILGFASSLEMPGLARGFYHTFAISQLRWSQVITPGALIYRCFSSHCLPHWEELFLAQLVGGIWVPPSGVQAAESTQQQASPHILPLQLYSSWH